MASLEGRAVVLTGASGGIGAEVARRLGAEGVRLVVSGRRAEQLERLSDEVTRAGAPAPIVITADLGQPGAAERLAASARDALGRIDVLINNAGVGAQGLAWVVGDGTVGREVFETNLWSPLVLIAAVAPEMVSRGSGVIVNVGSMARVAPFPHLGHYAASKAALSSATEAMQMELEPRGVRVVEVALGPVDTPGSRKNRVLHGAEKWLEGRPGLGKASSAATAIVAAAEGRHRVVFYPRMLRWVDRFPALGRHYAWRMAKHADVRDETIRSDGDPAFRSLREDWDNERGAGAL